MSARARVLAAVAVGGMLGASARYGLALAMPTAPGGFPWATLAANAAGSLLLGAVLVTVAHRFPPPSAVVPFVATGVLGSFTTFSAFVIEGQLLARDGSTVLAAAYWVTSIAAGLVAAGAGLAAGRALLPARSRAASR